MPAAATTVLVVFVLIKPFLNFFVLSVAITEQFDVTTVPAVWVRAAVYAELYRWAHDASWGEALESPTKRNGVGCAGEYAMLIDVVWMSFTLGRFERKEDIRKLRSVRSRSGWCWPKRNARLAALWVAQLNLRKITIFDFTGQIMIIRLSKLPISPASSQSRRLLQLAGK